MGGVYPSDHRTVFSRLHHSEQWRCNIPEFSRTEGSIIPDEQEVMTMLDELPAHIKLIAVHMEATDHGQTTRAILRNEAMHHEIEMSRPIIPQDGETIIL